MYAIIQFLFVASAINASVNNVFVVACSVSVLLLSALKSGKCVMMFVTLSNVSLLDELKLITHFGNSSTHVTFCNDWQL